MYGRLVPTQTHMNLNRAIIIIAINIIIITFMSTDSKKRVWGGCIRAGTDAFQNLQALIKNPLWAQIHQKCGHYPEWHSIIWAYIVFCMREL